MPGACRRGSRRRYARLADGQFSSAGCDGTDCSGSTIPNDAGPDVRLPNGPAPDGPGSVRWGLAPPARRGSSPSSTDCLATPAPASPLVSRPRLLFAVLVPFRWQGLLFPGPVFAAPPPACGNVRPP